jgi:hypothetical protein
MLDVGRVNIVAHDLSGIVDADRLRLSSARKLNIAEAAATVRKPASHAGQVVVDANDQTGAIEACREAKGRVRNGQDLVHAVHEGECGEHFGAAVELERARRVTAFAVEDQRPARTWVVDTYERVDLRDSKPLRDGIFFNSEGSSLRARHRAEVQQAL